MRIVDVTEFFSERGGGVRSHLTSKGAYLKSAGHQQIVFAPGPKAGWHEGLKNVRGTSTGGESAPLFDGTPLLRVVPGPRLPYDPSYSVLWNIRRIRREVALLGPDVVEAHSPYVAAASVTRDRGSPGQVRTMVWHSDFVDTNAEVLRQLAPKMRTPIAGIEAAGWRWARHLAARSDATLVAARWQKEKLDRHGMARVQLLPFGVDTTLFSPAARSEALRHELLGGAEPGTKLVMAIGRMSVEKRWWDVFESFLHARAQGAQARLVVLGDGPERSALEARYGAHPAIAFLGFESNRERLASILASGDVLLHACPFETFGLAVAEALATGLYAVLPREGGAAEFCDEDRARSYQPGNASEAAAVLRAQLLRPYDGKRGFSRSEASYFNDLVSLYAELRATRLHGSAS